MLDLNNKRFKALKNLQQGSTLQVLGTTEMQKWMKDTISPNPEDTSKHLSYITAFMHVERPNMLKNVIMVSEPMRELANQNFKRMIDAVKLHWIKDQTGVLIEPDGGMFVYNFTNVPEEQRHGTPEVEREQCIGVATILYFDKTGVLINVALVSSRIDYDFEKDMKRKLMFDTPYGTAIGFKMFAPVIALLGFIQFSDTEKIVVNTGQKTKCKAFDGVYNRTGQPIKVYDSRWVREIIRTEGFKVRGHFRMQPYKVAGKVEHKLIYINEYNKHGYHRRAQKDIENEIKD